jgi:tryptophanyl-tRNA synthetase
MAADILAYHAMKVPVGDDQRQHLELANDIGEKFNHDYGVEFFPRIEALILPETARVMSLRDGTKKMSKSDPSDQSRINLTDSAEQIELKIRRAQTDPAPLPETAEGLSGRPEAANLVGIYAALAGRSVAEVLREFGGAGFGVFKPRLSEVLVERLRPIGQETRRLLGDAGYLTGVLREGARRAAAVAGPIVDEAERIVGFVG